MRDRLLDRFELAARGSTVAREVASGLVTFVTSSYILFVQPALLGQVGMDASGVLFATCVASAVACFMMGLLANLPVALAPGMGTNFYFVFAVCLGMGWAWQQALAANFMAGALFLLLGWTGFREKVMAAIPHPIRYAIGVGIGLLIARVGLEWGGLIRADEATLVGLGDLGAPTALLTLCGIALGGSLLALRVPGALLASMLATAGLGALGTAFVWPETTLVAWDGVVGGFPSPAGTAFQLDFAGLLSRPADEWLAVVLVLFFVDLCDSVGTLLGVADRANLLDGDGRLPKARQALGADAAGTCLGALLGTTTITSYLESAAGVATGGRTGLVAIVVGLCLLAALFFAPLMQSVGGGVMVDGKPLYPVLAPVLILIGAIMCVAVTRIPWEDLTRGIPAFLTIIMMPFTLSITEGIAFGLIAYSALHLLTLRPRSVPLLTHLLAAALLARYVWL